MSDPAVIAIPIDVWTKVATGVTDGFISVLKPTMYLQTFRDTLGSAPTDKSDAVALTERFAMIKSDVAIDVYLMAITRAGSVRVDL